MKLYKFQEDWNQDDSRFKLMEKCRQIGGSFGAALEPIRRGSRKKDPWVIFTIGERQARNFMEDVKTHARAFRLASEILSFDFWSESEHYNLKGFETTLPNGTRITALPSNPDAARSFHGHLRFDEYAFHRNARATWKAAFPVATRGGYTVGVISTHNGNGTHFYELCTSGDKKWSRHRIDIYDAVKQGVPIDIEELREAINDDEAFQEEYECIPLDGASNWIPLELIIEAESLHCTQDLRAGFVPEGELYLGWDVGRKKDLTVIWLIEIIDGIRWTRAIEILKAKKFKVQFDRLCWYLDNLPIRRGCGDETGLGMQLCESLKEKYGARVEGVTFTQKAKEDLAVTEKRAFEDHILKIPAGKDLRADIRAIKRYITSAGNPRFDSERSEKGHSDRFWALALALHAGSGPAGKIEYQRVGPKRMSAGLRAAF